MNRFGAIVPDRVLNVLVPEVVLQGARVVAIVGQLESAGVAVQQKVYAKTLPKCSVESAMNSMHGHRKNPVCHKSC